MREILLAGDTNRLVAELTFVLRTRDGREQTKDLPAYEGCSPVQLSIVCSFFEALCSICTNLCDLAKVVLLSPADPQTLLVILLLLVFV